MVNESNKIIVKVGNKSKLRFANSKVYRAITANDLNALTSKYTDCKLVVIENISEEEQDAVKEFALNFKSKSDDNAVLFYIPDSSDEITSGIADELDYNIYLTDSDLYKYIYDEFGINVSVYLDDRKRLNSEELSESIPDGITDIFGGIGDESEDDISSAIAAIDEADKIEAEHTETVESTENTDDETVGEKDVETPMKNSDTIEDNTNVHEIKEDNSDNVTDSNIKEESKAIDKKAETIDKEQKAIDKEQKAIDKEQKAIEKVNNKHLNKKDSNESTEVTLEKEDTKTLEKKAETVEEQKVSNENLSDDTSEYIEELKMQIRDAKYDYNEVLKDMKEANARIESLEKTIQLITDEKNSILERVNELMVSDDIAEDPISLAKYETIKSNADSLEAQVIELKSTIDMLNNTIESKDMDINSAEASIDEFKQTVEELKSKLANANKSIESGEAFKEKADEYEEKLKSTTTEKDKIAERLSVVEEDNNKLQESLTSVTIRAEEEANARLELLEKLKVAIVTVRDKNKELIEQLSNCESQNNDLSNKLSSTERQLKESRDASKDQLEKIATLEKLVKDNNRKIEMATSSSGVEIEKLNDTVSQLKTKLKVTEDQLRQKESQYDNLVATSGMDENGANALIQTNQTLENISKTLREQLATATRELEKHKKNEHDAVRQLNGYKNQVQTLQKSLQSLASVGGVGSGGNVSVRTIQPGMTQSQIITVFGSGSFGITTTAMSLAQKLAATSKVLYVDFDLVSPMADSWFKINPIINGVPGTMNGSIQNSGLGLFLEHGIGTINQYLNNIIRLVNKTKGGGLHYLSGLYYRPDTYKLATANYDELFNTLGSNFQYIIVDFGRLGSSEIGDQLIKAVSDIAYRNIVVTTTNQFEVRNFKSKLSALNINLNSIAWLVNMCASTALDQKLKDSLNPCKYELLPRMEQYGAQESFLRTQITRDRFGLFIDRTVFGR